MVVALIVAQEAEEHNPLIPEINELIYGTLAFLIVFVVLAKVAFPRISQALQQRSDKIQGEMQKAERTREEADRILEDYRRQLAGAREESNRIIEEARKTAESMRRDLTEKAEREAEHIVTRAQEEIRGERERAFSELRQQVGELSVELATRVVGQSLDRDRQLRLVEDYIEELTVMGGGDGGRERGGGS
jgi:F-type H+-transporting ATPase subunit b